MKDNKKNKILLNEADLETVSGGFESDEMYDRYNGFVTEERVLVDNSAPLPCPNPSCRTKYTVIWKGKVKGKKAWICEKCGKLHYISDTI